MKSHGCSPCPAEVDATAWLRRTPASGARPPAGVALITVLLIVFLASIAAVSLASLQQRAIRRSAVFQHQQQARLYTLGAEQLALIVLARDRQNSETDHPGEEWASLPASLPVEGGALTARVRDLQGCFNLNNLWRPGRDDSPPASDQAAPESPDVRKPDQPAPPDAAAPPKPAASAAKAGLEPSQLKLLQRLLESLDLKPALALAIADWIDPDPDPQFPDGAEDSDYAVRNPPYLAANRPLVSVSELRLIKGLEREAYDRLAPLVCALPPGTPLNVNTAPATILAVLGDGNLKAADLERLLKERPADGYRNVDDFLNAAQLTTVEAPVKALLSTASQYFLLQAEARVGDGRAMLYSMLYRDQRGVRVLRRGFGNQD